MMNKKQFIESEKDCASMMGLSLKEYHKNIHNIKIPTTKKKTKRYDNSILERLGLTTRDLKKRNQ